MCFALRQTTRHFRFTIFWLDYQGEIIGDVLAVDFQGRPDTGLVSYEAVGWRRDAEGDDPPLKVRRRGARRASVTQADKFRWLHIGLGRVCLTRRLMVPLMCLKLFGEIHIEKRQRLVFRLKRKVRLLIGARAKLEGFL